MDALKKFVVEWKDIHLAQNKIASTGQSQNAEVMTVAQLMEKMTKKATGINLLEIEGYLKRSKVSYSRVQTDFIPKTFNPTPSRSHGR